MADAAAFLKEAFDTEGAAGKYQVLYCLSLFVIWLVFYGQNRKEKTESGKALWSYGLLSLCILWSPPAVWLFVTRLNVIESAREWFAALPVLLLPAYAGTLLCAMQTTRNRKWLSVLCCTLLIALSGTILPYHSAAQKSRYADRQVEAVLEAVSAQKEYLVEPVVLLGPQEILECARRYDGELELLYGKDLWMPGANTAVADVYSQDYVYLYERMKTDYQYPEEMARLAARFGCNVIVLREKIAPESEAYEHWTLEAEIPGYVVYRISK